MKSKITLLLISICFFASAQNIEFGYVQNVSDPYEFTFVMIPDFNSTDFSSVRFEAATAHFILPTGESISSLTQITGNQWSVTTFDGSTLQSCCTIGDGTLDYFEVTHPNATSNFPLTFNAGDQIQMFSFAITSSPESGSFEFREDTDSFVAAIIAQNNGGDKLARLIIDNASQDLSVAIEGTLDMYPFFPLSTSDFNTLDFSIYPNPNKGVFRVNLTNNSSSPSFKVMDIKGREIKGIKTTFGNQNIEVNASNLASGMYIININGNLKRLVIE